MKRRWMRRLAKVVAGVAALLGTAFIGLYWNTARLRDTQASAPFVGVITNSTSWSSQLWRKRRMFRCR